MSASRARTEAVLLALIVLLAAAVRLVPVVTEPEQDNHGYGSFGDTRVYHLIATNLLRGNGFSASEDGSAWGADPVELERYEPAVTRPPLYPSFLAAVYRLVGDTQDTPLESLRVRWDAVRLIQGVLDALVCIFVYLAASEMAPASRWAPLVAAAVYGTNPYTIYYTKELLSESLAIFLLAAGLAACVAALRHGGRLGWLGAGALLGVAALTHPQVLPFVGVLAGWLFLRNRANRWEGLRLGLVCVAGALLAIAPWAVRNMVVFHRPVLISVGALGHRLFLGSYETKENWSGWGVLPEEVFPDAGERAEIARLQETLFLHLDQGSIEMAETDRRFRTLALREIREHPGRSLAAWIDGVPRLWFQNYIHMYRDREASGAFFLLYFALALYAAARASATERAAMVPAGLLVAYLTVFFFPMNVEARYGVTAMPWIIAVAGVGLARLPKDAVVWWHSATRGWKRSPAAGGR